MFLWHTKYINIIVHIYVYTDIIRYYNTWTLASVTDPVFEESEHAFLYLSIVALTLQQKTIYEYKYIYICVCVCVCVLNNYQNLNPTKLNKKNMCLKWSGNNRSNIWWEKRSISQNPLNLNILHWKILIALLK